MRSTEPVDISRRCKIESKHTSNPTRIEVTAAKQALSWFRDRVEWEGDPCSFRHINRDKAFKEIEQAGQASSRESGKDNVGFVIYTGARTAVFAQSAGGVRTGDIKHQSSTLVASIESTDPSLYREPLLTEVLQHS